MITDRPTSGPPAADHVVHFYEHDAELVDAVLAHITDPDDVVAIVIATADHRRAIDRALAAAPGSAPARLVALDAGDTLSSIMVDSAIDPAACDRVIGGLLRDAAVTGGPVRVFGEMVALLWAAGDVIGAMALEARWNDLRREVPFGLLCGYPAAWIEGGDDDAARQHICCLHGGVTSPPLSFSGRYPAALDSPGRARRELAAALSAAGNAEGLVLDAALVIGELASNAVRHAASAFTLMVRAQPGTLRIAVADHHPPPAGHSPAAMAARPTHGLGIVNSVALRWGVEAAPGGKVVWAELAA